MTEINADYQKLIKAILDLIIAGQPVDRIKETRIYNELLQKRKITEEDAAVAFVFFHNWPRLIYNKLITLGVVKDQIFEEEKNGDQS